MTGDSSVELALRCYPGWWRARYADEVQVVAADLAAEGRSPVVITLNLLRGAMQVRSRAQGMPKVYGLWSARTRVSVTAATLPWLLVAPLVLIAMGSESLRSSAGQVIWSGFSLFPTHLQVAGAASSPAPPLTSAASVVGYASLAIAVLFVVTLIVLACGWGGLTGAISRSTTSHRRSVLLLARAPGFALLADIALVIAQWVVGPHAYRSTGGTTVVPLDGHPAAAHVLGIVLGIVAVVGWIFSIACVAVAAKRAEVEPSDLRFGKSVSTIVATLFALLLAAYVTWGVGLIVQARQAAHGNFTTMTFSRQDLWLPMALVLFLAVVLSGLSARVARRSWKVLTVSVL